MNQRQALLRYLKTHKRGITQLDAINKLGIARLSERVRELEKIGAVIEHRAEQRINRHGNMCRYVRYILVKAHKSS